MCIFKSVSCIQLWCEQQASACQLENAASKSPIRRGQPSSTPNTSIAIVPWENSCPRFNRCTMQKHVCSATAAAVLQCKLFITVVPASHRTIHNRFTELVFAGQAPAVCFSIHISWTQLMLILFAYPSMYSNKENGRGVLHGVGYYSESPNQPLRAWPDFYSLSVTARSRLCAAPAEYIASHQSNWDWSSLLHQVHLLERNFKESIRIRMIAQVMEPDWIRMHSKDLYPWYTTGAHLPKIASSCHSFVLFPKWLWLQQSYPSITVLAWACNTTKKHHYVQTRKSVPDDAYCWSGGWKFVFTQVTGLMHCSIWIILGARGFRWREGHLFPKYFLKKYDVLKFEISRVLKRSRILQGTEKSTWKGHDLTSSTTRPPNHDWEVM